jgi:hypothetical protein
VPAGDSVWSILYRWQRSTVSLACTMIRVAIVAARPNKERFPLITAALDSKVATAPFLPIYHEHNHDSKHNLIDCIGILPRDDIYLPLAGSLLPIPTTYLYRAGRHYKGELMAMIYMFQRDLGGQSVAMFSLEPAQCSYFWDYLAHTQFQSEPPLPNLDPESFWGYPSRWLVPLPSLQVEASKELCSFASIIGYRCSLLCNIK